MNKLENKIINNTRINREYGLVVKVDVRHIDIKDVKRDGTPTTYKSRMIYLIPQVSTASTFFFDAWLPSLTYKDNGEIYHHEVAVRFAHPLYRTIRFGVCRKNQNYPEAHHLVLMNSESSEDILAQCFGQNLQVMVLPDNVAEASIEG